MMIREEQSRTPEQNRRMVHDQRVAEAAAGHQRHNQAVASMTGPEIRFAMAIGRTSGGRR